MVEGFVNTTIILVVSLIGTILIGTMAAYAIDRFAVPRSRSSSSALFLIATLIPGVTSQVATFQIINGLGLFNTDGRADPALHGHRHHRRSTSSSSSCSRSRVSLDEAAMIDGANRWTIYWRIILPLLKPAIATVVIIKGIAIYNEFYLPFLYLPVRGRPDLHLAVPVQGPVRRAVGGHRRRHHPRHRPHPHRLPASCSGSSTTASPQEPSSEPHRTRTPCHVRLRPLTPAGGSRRVRARRRRHRRRSVPATVPGCGAHRPAAPPGSSPTRTSTTTSAARLDRAGRLALPHHLRLDPAELPTERHDLVFDGLDTVADIELNGGVARRDRATCTAATASTSTRRAARRARTSSSCAFRAPVPYADAQSLDARLRPRP